MIQNRTKKPTTFNLAWRHQVFLHVRARGNTRRRFAIPYMYLKLLSPSLGLAPCLRARVHEFNDSTHFNTGWAFVESFCIMVLLFMYSFFAFGSLSFSFLLFLVFIFIYLFICILWKVFSL